MKIMLLTSRAGADFSQNVGDVIEVEAAEALRMIAADQAIAHDAKPPVETAVKKTPKRETR